MHEAGHGTAADASAVPLGARLQALTDTWRALTETRLGIFAIEARRAGRSVALMLACAIGAACVAAGTWWMLCIAAVWWAVERGAEPGIAVACALLANVVFIFVLALLAKRYGTRIRFDHTRRALRAPEDRP